MGKEKVPTPLQKAITVGFIMTEIFLWDAPSWATGFVNPELSCYLKTGAYFDNELVEHAICGTKQITPEMLDSFENIKMISRLGVGFDNLPLEHCKNRGIALAYTPLAPTNAVVEYVLGQVLNWTRNISYSHSVMLDNDLALNLWNQKPIGLEISDIKIGVVGYGRIGSRVAKMFDGLGCIVRAYDNDPEVYIPEHMRCEPEKIWESDVVTVHIPLVKDNYNCIGMSELSQLMQSANPCLVINTSRGNIINEGELLEWVKLSKNNFAAVDVFSKEPHIGLLQHGRIFTTPHSASSTTKARASMINGAIQNILNFVDGLVYPDVFKDKVARQMLEKEI